MVNKHTERYSTSRATRKTQIKIMSIRMAQVKIVIIPIAGKAAKKWDQLYIAGENVKCYIHTGKINQLLVANQT